MVGRSDSKRLLWDGRTRVLLACASIPVMIETAYLYGIGDGGDMTMLFMLLAVVGGLLMALLPRIGGWAIVALWAARCIVPETTPFSLLFCLLMAVTIMAYLNIGMALMAAVAAEAATASRIWLYPWDSSVFAIVCATAAFLMVALWLGSMMSWRERQEIEDQEHAELVRRIADQELATQLHHSVANDLTTILLLARQLQTTSEPSASADDGDSSITATYESAIGPVDNSQSHASEPADTYDEADAHTIALIEQTARESLAKVRTLIAGLDRGNGRVADRTNRSRADADDSVPVPQSAPARLVSITADELHTIAGTYAERLRANGLTGDIIIGGESSCSCTVERRDALFDILREIVGNMMKYADPAAGYCIAITLAPGLATLSASNGLRYPVADDATSSSDGLSSLGDGSAVSAHGGDAAIRMPDALSGGTGLDRCRRVATALGGEFTAEHDVSSWTVLLKLPLA